jgi:hypothetical protein
MWGKADADWSKPVLKPARRRTKGTEALPLSCYSADMLDQHKEMVPLVRLELTTYRLQGGCSTS